MRRFPRKNSIFQLETATARTINWPNAICDLNDRCGSSDWFAGAVARVWGDGRASGSGPCRPQPSRHPTPV